MQFTSVIATLFAAAGAVALPADVVERQVLYTPCSGLSGSPVCCATDVLGVVNLDCGNRTLLLSPLPSMLMKPGDLK